MSQTTVGIRHKIALVPNQSPSSVDEKSPNHAFVLRQKGEFFYENRPVPELPSENHVIVIVKATGLCGSDV